MLYTNNIKHRPCIDKWIPTGTWISKPQ
jgi:hypothetical protein